MRMVDTKTCTNYGGDFSYVQFMLCWPQQSKLTHYMLVLRALYIIYYTLYIIYYIYYIQTEMGQKEEKCV